MANATTEIEVKLLDIDPEKLETTLREHKAKQLFKGRVRDIQFDFYDRSLRDTDKLLRLRQLSDNSLELVFKGPRFEHATVKQREEVTLPVENGCNPETVVAFFAQIGLQMSGYQEKDRVSYGLRNVRFEIDHYPSIPPYVEIEGSDEASISHVIRELGLEHHERSMLSSDEVFKRYNPNGNFSNLRF